MIDTDVNKMIDRLWAEIRRDVGGQTSQGIRDYVWLELEEALGIKVYARVFLQIERDYADRLDSPDK